MEFRNDIQGLRSLAFVLVFVFHLNSAWLPGGFLGVDIFFVISGYLMTPIILREISKGDFSFINFFIKRIKRIVPAYLVLLFVVAIAAFFIFLVGDIANLRTQLPKTSLFLSNTIFSTGNSYFGATLLENPLLHTWSLAIEMQFYILLPFILYFFRKNILTVLIVLTIALTIYSTFQIEILHHQSIMYFSLLSRIPEFFVGSIFSLIFKNRIDITRLKNNVISVFSLIVLLICCFLISEHTHFPGYVALIPCIATSFILVTKNNVVSDFFSSKIAVFIGLLSYSLYLWHWPIMAYVRYSREIVEFNFYQIVFICISTFALSWLSFYLIENKMRKLNNRKFILISIPFLTVYGLFLFNMVKISSYLKPKESEFSRPIFGLLSNNSKNVETFGDISKKDSILLIGSSHAMMTKPFLDYLGKEHHFSFQTLTCDSYLAIPGINPMEIPSETEKFFLASKTFIPLTQKLIKESRIIIINAPAFNKLPSLYTALETLIKTLRSDQSLILLNSFPTIDKHPIRLNKGIIKTSSYIFTKDFGESDARSLQDLAAKYENVYFYNLGKSKIFKNAPYINDTVSYFDKNHINTFGSIKLAKDLDEDFMALLNSLLRKP